MNLLRCRLKNTQKFFSVIVSTDLIIWRNDFIALFIKSSGSTMVMRPRYGRGNHRPQRLSKGLGNLRALGKRFQRWPPTSYLENSVWSFQNTAPLMYRWMFTSFAFSSGLVFSTVPMMTRYSNNESLTKRGSGTRRIRGFSTKCAGRLAELGARNNPPTAGTVHCKAYAEKISESKIVLDRVR